MAAIHSFPLDPRAAGSGGQGRILVQSNDPNVVPNDGLRANLTGFGSAPEPAQSSFQVGVEEVIGAYEAVFGLFSNSGTGPTAFFSVFTNQTDQNVRLGYWPTYPVIEGQAYDFALQRSNGTLWSLTINGQLFGGNASASSFDFRTAQATWAVGLSFSQVAIYQNVTTVPGSFVVPLALAVHLASGWYLPTSGYPTYIGSGGAAWGVDGRDQHPSLAPGELETGTSIPTVANGTALWSTGPVGVRVGLTMSAPSVRATIPVAILAQVTATDGTPLPGVALFFNDSKNGSFLTTVATTNGTGGATAVLETPNLTAAGSDFVEARVTLFGFSGYAGASLDLTPAVQVFVRLQAAGATVAPNGALGLVALATDAQGHAQGGVLLTLTAVPAAGLSPAFGVTDSSGSVRLVLTAPAQPTTVVVTATAATAGVWGHGGVSVHVGVVTIPWYTRYGGTIEAVVFLAAVGLILGYLVYRRRRGHRAIPEMPLREMIREERARLHPSPPGPAGPPGGTHDPNRTPPGSGSP